MDALSNLPLSILKYLSDTKIFGDDLEPLIASKEKTLLYDTDPTVRDIEYDSSSDEEPSRPSSSLNSISFVSVIQSTPTHQDQPLASSSLDNSNNSMVKPANTSASSNDSSTITERGPSTTGRHVAGNARMDKFMKHFRDQRR